MDDIAQLPDVAGPIQPCPLRHLLTAEPSPFFQIGDDSAVRQRPQLQLEEVADQTPQVVDPLA